MRIFYAFLVIVATAILFLVPYTTVALDFQTDQRTDEFDSTATAVVATGANVVLGKPIFNNDTTLVTLQSGLATDAPVVSTYNTTSRQLTIGGLTVNTTRDMAVIYTVDALEGSTGINNLVDKMPWFILLTVICLAPVALFAIFTGKV